MTDSIINKIQALLDKAESSEYGPERDALCDKADELMVKYQIEQFQIEEARAAQGEARRSKPVVEVWLMPYVPRGSSGDHNWNLFTYICHAVGVRHLFEKFESVRDEDAGRNTTYYRMKMIGYPEDIKYCQMLFMSLRIQMLAMLQPKPDPTMPYDWNVYSLHNAGIKWAEIARQMNLAITFNVQTTRCPHDNTELEGHGDAYYCPKCGDEWGSEVERMVPNWDETPWPDGGRLIRAYKRHCALVGDEPHAVQSHDSYRRSFGEAFVERIWERLNRKRKEAGTALVLARRQTDIDALFNSLLPKTEDDEGDEDDSAKRKRVAKAKEPRYDHVAALRGRAAADRADMGQKRFDTGPKQKLS